MANPKGPPSAACASHADHLNRRGVCLLQRHGLQHTRHIGRLPKIKRFSIAAIPAAPRSWLAASPASTCQTPSANDIRCGSGRQTTIISLIRATLGRVLTAVKAQNYWCQKNKQAHNNNQRLSSILHHNQKGWYERCIFANIIRNVGVNAIIMAILVGGGYTYQCTPT